MPLTRAVVILSAVNQSAQHKGVAVPRSDWEAVRATPLFSQLSEANFIALRDAAVVHRLPKHAPLLKEGERPRCLFVLVEGSVELFGCHNGQAATIEVKEPISALALPTILRNTISLKSARTVTAVRVLALPGEAVREAFRRDGAFARAAAEDLAYSYAEVVRLLMNEKLRTSTERLAAWILRSCVEANSNALELKFNKRILASRLGMAPENLSRNLAYLERFGVKSEGRGILVEDLASLQEFAKPNALIDGMNGAG
jgi:CRP/FNR family transcriptional regulator, transcriptional activator FtrB